MKKFLLFCAPLVGLFATVNEPWHFEISSGYRNDRVHWHLQDRASPSNLTYQELDRNVQFWQNALTLQTIYRDFFFCLEGAYGGLGRGEMFQDFPNLSFAQDIPRFQSSTVGYCADVETFVGYAVNLTEGRHYQVLLTPLMGFSAHFEKIGHTQSPLWVSEQAIGASLYSLSSAPYPLHTTWYGLVLGGDLSVSPGGPFQLDAGYTYHWLHLHMHTKMQTELFLSSPPTTQQIFSWAVQAQEGGCIGHTVWASAGYHVDRFWVLGLSGQVHYFSSKFIDTSIDRTTQTILPSPSTVQTSDPQTLKMRFFSLSFSLEASRSF